MKGSSILPVVLVVLTPILVFTLIVLGVAFEPVRWEPPSVWSIEFGTLGANVWNRVTAISVVPEGLYDAGYVGFDQVGGNAAPGQLFVSLYDLSHHLKWSQPFGNPEWSQITRVAGGADGVYVVGHLNSTVFLRKYGLEGSLAWTANLTGPSSLSGNAGDISVGTTGVYVVSSNLLSNSSYAKRLRAFDFEGNVLWTLPIGNSVSLTGVSAGTNGLYASGGFSNGTSAFVQRYDFNGGLVWTRQLGCVCRPSGVGTDATGLYVAGQDANLVEAFITRYDWDGNRLWIHEFRPPDTAVSYLHMSADSSGVYMAIITMARDYLAKYDGNGNRIWLFQIPITPYTVSVGGGSVYVGGDTQRRTEGRSAALSEFGQSSSLIFFGLNPPFSFLTVGILAATVISAIWLRRRRKSRVRLPDRSNLGSRGIPADIQGRPRT